MTTTSPLSRKPTTTTRWPFEAEIGAPDSSPLPNEIDATSGIPAATNSSASRSDRSRVTKAWPASGAAYAVLNGQFPVPWYAASYVDRAASSTHGSVCPDGTQAYVEAAGSAS